MNDIDQPLQKSLIDFTNEQMLILHESEPQPTAFKPYTDAEVSGYSYWRSDFDRIVKAVMAMDLLEARHIAHISTAREIYQTEQSRRSSLEMEARRDAKDKAEQDRKDLYLTSHTAFPWNGPKEACHVSKTVGYGQCSKRADFAIVTSAPTERRPDLSYAVALECTVHATRVPKYGSWSYYPSLQSQREFAADNARWLKGLITAEGLEATVARVALDRAKAEEQYGTDSRPLKNWSDR